MSYISKKNCQYQHQDVLMFPIGHTSAISMTFNKPVMAPFACGHASANDSAVFRASLKPCRKLARTFVVFEDPCNASSLVTPSVCREVKRFCEAMELMGWTCSEEGKSPSRPSGYKTHARRQSMSTGSPNKYDLVSRSSYRHLPGPCQKRMRCSLMHAPCALAH